VPLRRGRYTPRFFAPQKTAIYDFPFQRRKLPYQETSKNFLFFTSFFCFFALARLRLLGKKNSVGQV
jgi:hypothetical protein